MARRAKDQFRHKIKPGDKQQPARRPKPKRSKKDKRQGGFFGFVGAVGTLAAVCVGVLFHQRRQQLQKQERDSAILAKMRQLPLRITEHAECRMGCRHVGRDEVEAVLSSGSINGRKSEPDMLPCPKYVIDGQSGGGKNVECVVSACPQVTNLVTVIDLDNDWPNCYCP